MILDYILNASREFVRDVRQHGFIRGYNGLSVQEIAEKMKPVPYQEIADRLPSEFAHNLRLILEEEVA